MKKLLIALGVVLPVVSSMSFAVDVNSILPTPTILIKAGSHTGQQNKEHQKICAMGGAIDVTDTCDLKVTSGVSDVVVCIKSTTGEFTAGAGAFSGNLLEANIGFGASLIATAPNGTVQGPYTIIGYGSYNGFPVGSGLAFDVGVPLDNCRAIGAMAIPYSSGVGYLETSCSFPSGRNPTPSYTSLAMSGGVSSYANGMIYHD